MGEAISKKSWQSKQNWLALLTAVASFFPAISGWVAAHPDLFMQLTAVAAMVLRQLTKGKIELY